MSGRWAAFAGENYYARGGIDDLVGVYRTREEAEAAARKASRPGTPQYDRWWHVVDLDALAYGEGATAVESWIEEARPGSPPSSRKASDWL